MVNKRKATIDHIRATLQPTELDAEWPSADAIDRIASAVGDKHSKNLVDRDAFCETLLTIRWERLQRSTEQLAIRKRSAGQISRWAEALAAMLEGSTGDGLLDLHLRWELDRREELIPMLLEVSAAAKAGAELGEPRGPLKRWLAAQLIAAWQQHFKGKPAISHRPEGGEPYGPLVRFVRASAKEMGVTVSAETVAMAAKAARRQG